MKIDKTSLRTTTGLSVLSNIENIVIKLVGFKSYQLYLDFSDTILLDAQNPKDSIAQLFKNQQNTPLIFSGLIGFFSYDILANHAGVNCQARKDVDSPDGIFSRPSTIISIKNDKVEIESLIPNRCQQLKELCDGHRGFENKQSNHSSSLECNIAFKEYQKIFAEAQAEIINGNTYQIKISQRFKSQQHGNGISLFERLMDKNPAPESFYYRWGDFSMISCSPETVIHTVGKTLITKPIGGTYKKDHSNCSKENYLHFFAKDEKEVSEHNMIVDLERNDLSRICNTGTVNITKFREIEEYEHLYHLVTTIEGQIKDSTNGQDIIKSMLPGGSITGCPKIKTMQLIDRLEPCARGAYTGSFGTIADNGDMHFNLIIRTIMSLHDKFYIQAGGGIVMDSTAAYEYQENLTKAKSLIEVLQSS